MFEEELNYIEDEKQEEKLNVTFKRLPNNIFNQDGELVSSQEEDFVTIQAPGDNSNILIKIVDDETKRRFKRKWKAYKNFQDAGSTGIQIADWPEMKPAMVEDFKRVGFNTVEQIAMASEVAFATLQGGQSWKFKAQKYLESRKSEIVADQQSKIDAQQAQIDELKAMVQAMVQAPARGRPPKQEAAEA